MKDLDSPFRNTAMEEAYFLAKNLEQIRMQEAPKKQEKTTLLCPVCQTVMKSIKMGSADLDICDECGGGFLKRSSLEAVLTDQSELTLGQFWKRWLKTVSEPTQIYQTPCP